jgi:hypothetical protein
VMVGDDGGGGGDDGGDGGDEGEGGGSVERCWWGMAEMRLEMVVPWWGRGWSGGRWVGVRKVMAAGGVGGEGDGEVVVEGVEGRVVGGGWRG